MSPARPGRAAARAASERMAIDTNISDDEPAPAVLASKKRARGGQGRAEFRRQSRGRAEPSQLSPEQKMEKMRLWFERN